MTPLQTAIAAAGALALLAGSLFLARRRRTDGRARFERLANLSLSLASASLLYLGAETWLYRFPQSDNFAFTLSAQRWFARHWGPVNSRGFRDAEHPIEALHGRRVLLAVGDSFVAGQGIENRADRFPDRLQQLLGDGWRVVNLGRQGWSTGAEARAIAGFPHEAEVVVLSYHVNDILDAARRCGYREPYAVKPPPGWARPWVEHSYVADFVYWRLVRLRSLQTLSKARRQSLPQCFFSPEIWAEHERELVAVTEAVAARGGKLVVVLFPHLVDIEGSRASVALVHRWFEQRGVPVLDLATVLAGRDPAEIIVNPYDAHANEAVHRELAELLAPLVRAQALPAAL